MSGKREAPPSASRPGGAAHAPALVPRLPAGPVPGLRPRRLVFDCRRRPARLVLDGWVRGEGVVASARRLGVTVGAVKQIRHRVTLRVRRAVGW